MSIIQMIIIQIITFAALVLVLRRFMYTEASKEARRLQQLNQESAIKAKELGNKIDEAEKECRKKLFRAEDEANKLRAQAKEDAVKIKDEILEKARRESEHIVEAALNVKDKVRREMALQMQEKIPDLVVQIYKETFFSNAREITHQGLIEEVVKELEKIDNSRFDTEIKNGELMSAYPFKSGERDELFSRVFQKLGYNLPITEKEDKDLIAGIIIKLGGLVIDGSLSNRIRRAGERLKIG